MPQILNPSRPKRNRKPQTGSDPKSADPGDATAAADRLALIAGIPILAITEDARALAYELVSRKGIPATEPRDALHISLAATNGIQYLMTLNFTHIANAETRLLIEQICRDFGCTPPVICSPDELLGN